MALLPPDPVYILRGNTPIQSLAFHKGFDRLFSGDQEGTVNIWGLQTNRIENTIKVGDNNVIHLSHTKDNLITQDKNGKIKYWNFGLKGYEIGEVIYSDYIGFSKFSISESDKLLIVPDKNSVIKAYNLQGYLITEIVPDDPKPLGIVMCTKIITLHNEVCILAAYESGDLLLWNLNKGKILSNLKLSEFPITLDYDQTANRGVYGSSSNIIHVFSIKLSTDELFKKCDINLKNSGINHLQIRNDKKVFASGGWDGSLRIFSWKSLRPLAVMNVHNGPINCISYSEDKISTWSNSILAAAGNDGNISLWDLYN
ncbi:guanine nucleotide-binding protein subunit beta-like protein 1 [Ctenocephalides felis]|uniref:guanine nucleotide-binding protein subunit beta-like protein 1 n=1 Tax=Ctenocephalides felis TaxID=7515 RepID=UPI000E6E2802|nr:guanine nucleotide-binding protein subunit beta-like protein 1 [Ctenocephalides felis]